MLCCQSTLTQSLNIEGAALCLSFWRFPLLCSTFSPTVSGRPAFAGGLCRWKGVCTGPGVCVGGRGREIPREDSDWSARSHAQRPDTVWEEWGGFCDWPVSVAVLSCVAGRALGSRSLPSPSQARGLVAAVEARLRGRDQLLPWSGLFAGTGSSANTPEETDDVDNAGLEPAVSGRVAPGAGAEAEAGELQADSSSGAQGGKHGRRRFFLVDSFKHSAKHKENP